MDFIKDYRFQFITGSLMLYSIELGKPIRAKQFRRDKIENGVSALAGNRLAGLGIAVILESKKDCENLINLIKTHSHCLKDGKD